jgi:hypothetical protein
MTNCKGLYDAFQWLKLIRAAGYETFTTAELGDMFVRKHWCKLKGEGFIKTIKKQRQKNNSSSICVWEINDNAIKRHKFGYIMYRE